MARVLGWRVPALRIRRARVSGYDLLAAAAIFTEWEAAMDFELTESQTMVRGLTRDFAAREIAPEVLQHADDEAWSIDILRRMAEIGLTGALVPEEYGGAGLDSVSHALVCETIGGASASVFTAFTVQTTLSE